MIFNRAKSIYFDFFFQKGSGLNLGITRFLFFSLSLLIFWNSSFEWYAEERIVDALWEPSFINMLLGLDKPFSMNVTFILCQGFKVGLFLSAIGLWTRISIPATAILGYYILGLEFGYIQSNFRWNVLTVSMGILSFSKSGDFFSVDAQIKKRYFHLPSPNKYSSNYYWPRKLILISLILMYFAAGIAKLRYSGADWVLNSSLPYVAGIAREWHSQNAFFDLQLEFNQWLIECAFVNAISFVTLFVELTSPLALINDIFKRIYLPVLICFHIGIFLTFFIYSSICLIPVYCFWFDWDKMLVEIQNLKKRLRARALLSAE